MRNKKKKSIGKELREIRDKMRVEIQHIASEELKAYLRKHKPLRPALYKTK